MSSLAIKIQKSISAIFGALFHFFPSQVKVIYNNIFNSTSLAINKVILCIYNKNDFMTILKSFYLYCKASRYGKKTSSDSQSYMKNEAVFLLSIL